MAYRFLTLTLFRRWTYTSTGQTKVNRKRQMIKGGGAALTREKIVACAADQFILHCLMSPKLSTRSASIPYRLRSYLWLEAWWRERLSI